MRNNSFRSGWLVFFGLVVLLVFALYSNSKTDSDTLSGGADESGIFVLAKDLEGDFETTAPSDSKRPAVEVTTLPDETPLLEATFTPEMPSASPTEFSARFTPSSEYSQSSQNAFAAYESEREEVRRQEIAMLTELETNADERISLEAAEAKLELVRCMEAEITLRGLMLAKGYKDAVVTVQTGSVNIAVLKNSLEEAEVATLLELASRETGEAPGSIKIIPVMEE